MCIYPPFVSNKCKIQIHQSMNFFAFKTEVLIR